MIKTIYFVFFICAFSLGLWACTGKDSDKFKNLSSDQFEEMIQDKTIQLVDVRTVAEYSEGVSIRTSAFFSPSYNKVKSQTKPVWLLTLL